MKELISLDENDIKILTFLQENGKASLRTVAKEVNISVSAVKNRIDRLQESNVIKTYTTLIDCEKIGYLEMLLLSIQVNNSVPINDILIKLQKIPQLNFVYHVSGIYPIFCMAKCLNKTSGVELIEKIKNVGGIEMINSQVVLQKIKEDTRLNLQKIKN